MTKKSARGGFLYFYTFFPGASIFGLLLHCESPEAGDYIVFFRRLASTQNLSHESYSLDFPNHFQKHKLIESFL